MQTSKLSILPEGRKAELKAEIDRYLKIPLTDLERKDIHDELIGRVRSYWIESGILSKTATRAQNAICINGGIDSLIYVDPEKVLHMRNVGPKSAALVREIVEMVNPGCATRPLATMDGKIAGILGKARELLRRHNVEEANADAIAEELGQFLRG